ncbi:unnamed protein product, partial [Hymenolepis diminuta]
KEEPRAGCSNKLNSEQLQVSIDEDPTCTTRGLSETFHISRHITIFREMKRLGWKSLKGWEMLPLPTQTICQESTSNSM